VVSLLESFLGNYQQQATDRYELQMQKHGLESQYFTSSGTSDAAMQAYTYHIKFNSEGSLEHKPTLRNVITGLPITNNKLKDEILNWLYIPKFSYVSKEECVNELRFKTLKEEIRDWIKL